MSRASLYVLPIVHGQPTEGIPMEILRPALLEHGRALTGAEIARELGLTHVAGKQAVSVMTQVGYIEPVPGEPDRLKLTHAGRKMFRPPTTSRITRKEALNAAMSLLAEARQDNGQETVCRVRAVTFFGGLLDADDQEVAQISAQVTVQVTRDAGAAVANHMRVLERRLLGVHPAMDLHLVLVPG